MAERALFISEQFIKDNSLINGNVDTKYITSTIYLVQRLYVVDILGTALYNEINAEILADSVSADNVTLIEDYLNDTILYYVLAEGMSLFTYKVENKSVSKKSSDNSQPISSEEVFQLKDGFMNKAEFFAQKTTNFLCANTSATKYNAFLNPGDDFDTVIPNRNNYESTWTLDDIDELPKGIVIAPSKFKS